MDHASTVPAEPTAPLRVAAVVVSHDGATWLPAVLATLRRQTYAHLTVCAVDAASTDGSAELLVDALGEDHVLQLTTNPGFGRALARALRDLPVVADIDLVLCVHDDLLLDPDAVAHLVTAFEADPELWIAGPKLREWDPELRLSEVGMTVDRFGRAETLLDARELDQGQHDTPRDVLYVSTAGMMMRPRVLRRVGGFDARYPAFRDDLDLCWRAWLAGLRVGVVPDAVGYHVGAASRRERRLGRGREWEARYLAERHTLATLLKNYGALRLVWVLPIVALLLAVRFVGFVATRRVGDAIATARAVAWNVLQLPRTLKRRRRVQSRRRRRDGDLVHLFAPGLPRAKSYIDAAGDWLAGGGTRAILDDDEEGTAPRRAATDPGGPAAVGWMRRHPAAVVGTLLALAYLAGASRLLGGGQLTGGELLAWPDATRALWEAWTSPVPGDPLAGPGAASPLLAVLALLGWVTVGSAWAAQRVFVLGLLPLAFALSLRAGRLVSAAPAPRVVGAALYALSPPLVGALAEGRIGVLVVGALLPGLLLLAARTTDGTGPRARSWRAAALLGLGLTLAGSASAALLPVLAVLWLAVLIASALRRRPGRWRATGRLAVSGLAAALLLTPWIVSLLLAGWSTVIPLAEVEALPLWRAALAVPSVVPGLAGAIAPALLSAAVVVAALLYGFPRRPLVVGGLVTILVVSGVLAWGAVVVGVDLIWPPAILLPGSLALAGLAVVAARFLGDALSRYSLGVAQLSALLLVGTVAVGLLGGVARIIDDPWVELELGSSPLPAFVTADATLGDYRVIILDGTPETVRWDVVPGAGPTLANTGAPPNPAMARSIRRALASTIGGADPGGPVSLGSFNVRYLVVPDPAAAPELIAALGRQPGLEPLPSSVAQVYAVSAWLPRAVVLDPDSAESLATAGDPGEIGDAERAGLTRLGAGRWAGPTRGQEGVLVLAESPDTWTLFGRDLAPGWRARAGGQDLDEVDLGEVTGFALPSGTSRAEITHGGRPVQTLLVTLQLLLVGLLGSIVLRPPGTGPSPVAGPRSLPGSVDLPPEGPPAVLPPPGLGSGSERPGTPASEAAAQPSSGADDTEDLARAGDVDGREDAPTGEPGGTPGDAAVVNAVPPGRDGGGS